jgi:hypothetical protein
VRFALAVVIGLVLALSGTALAGPILDGTGFGSASATVAYDAGAPISNFGSPGPTTSGAAYDIFTKQDADYIYVLVQTNGSGGSAAGTFANLYFGVGPDYHTGSTFGIEVTNMVVFTPGVPDNTAALASDIFYNTLSPDAIELAISWNYFETNPQGLGFTTVSALDPNITLRLSQSFGYSVAGGATYGDDRLGLFVLPQDNVPEPSSFAIILLTVMSLVGFAVARRQTSDRI